MWYAIEHGALVVLANHTSFSIVFLHYCTVVDLINEYPMFFHRSYCTLYAILHFNVFYSLCLTVFNFFVCGEMVYGTTVFSSIGGLAGTNQLDCHPQLALEDMRYPLLDLCPSHWLRNL